MWAARRRRLSVAVATSVAIHVVTVLVWAPRRILPRVVAPRAAGSTPVAFELVPAAARPRQTVVVVVGPGPAAAGGSPRASAPAGRGGAGRAPRTRGVAPPPASAPVAADQGAVDVPPAPPPSAAVAPLSLARDEDRAVVDLEDLIQQQGSRLAAGRGSGPGGFGACQGSGCPGFSLALDLSGRRVAGSPVRSVPVVVEQRQGRCELPAARLRAVVRLLVLRDGLGTAARLLESSGQAAFDACALRYAKGLRFAPGLDGAGRPLDVWIHVGVSSAAARGDLM